MVVVVSSEIKNNSRVKVPLKVDVEFKAHKLIVMLTLRLTFDNKWIMMLNLRHAYKCVDRDFEFNKRLLLLQVDHDRRG